MENIIEIRNMTKRFAKNVVALDNVSVNIKEGSFVAIMGPSGSGKSTLLNIIGLLDTQTEGTMSIQGNEVKNINSREKARLRMKTFGFVFQGFFLNAKLTAIDNVMMPMHINPDIKGRAKKKRAAELLSEFQMSEYYDRYPNELSGGEQQRVCIARALANNPDIILADEPTGNLDEENEKIIFTYLKQLTTEGKTVIVVSHNDSVKQYADKVITIVKGHHNVDMSEPIHEK